MTPGSPTSLWNKHPEDPIESYMAAYRLLARSRLDLMLVTVDGALRALSPIALKNSHWPYREVLRSGIPQPTRHLYQAPAEAAHMTNRPVILGPVQYETANRKLNMRITHIPFRDPSTRKFLSLSLTTHVATEGIWRPEILHSETETVRFNDLIQTQAILWAEANNYLFLGKHTSEAGREKAARIAACAGARLEGMLDAVYALGREWDQAAGS